MDDEQGCWLCGAVRDPADVTALAWASEREDVGEVRLLCPDCTRRHAPDIEAGLPSEYW